MYNIVEHFFDLEATVSHEDDEEEEEEEGLGKYIHIQHIFSLTPTARPLYHPWHRGSRQP